MSKEPGENLSINVQEVTKKDLAKQELWYFKLAMKDVEKEKRVALKEPARDFISVVEGREENRKEALEGRLEKMRGLLDCLDSEQRHEADILIKQAELYLSAYEPEKKK